MHSKDFIARCREERMPGAALEAWLEKEGA